MVKKKKFKKISFNAFELVSYLWTKKWILIIVTLVAFIISVIVSLSITPRFESKVILYPAAPVSISGSLTQSALISVDNTDILAFGDQNEAERMLQILNSGKVREYIVDKYDLMNHYEIDPESPYPYTQLDNKYKGNIRFRRTEYMSVEISVLDTDPQVSADIANDIATYIDSAFHQIQYERALDAFQVIEKEYLASQLEVERISDSLKVIRNLGVLDYESQVASLSEAYANAVVQRNNVAAGEINRQMDVLSRYGGIYVELSQELETEIGRMGVLKDKYIAYKSNIDEVMPQAFIVDHARKPERKALPDRSMIVIISTLSAFALALLLLLIVDYVKSVIQ